MVIVGEQRPMVAIGDDTSSAFAAQNSTSLVENDAESRKSLAAGVDLFKHSLETSACSNTYLAMT